MLRRIRPTAALLVLAWAVPASGQGLAAHLPSGPSARPFHERLAGADAVAIGTVRSVELGRIHVEAARALRGSPGESFSLKRAPSHPPPLETGDRVLLLLRGARSPYLLVDEPGEVHVLADAAEEAAWRETFATLDASGDAPETLRDVYLGWLSGADAALRDAARLGLASPDAPFAPLPPQLSERLLADALDPQLDPGRRRATAAVVLARPDRASALLERLALDPLSDDPQVLRQALAVGALQRLPELEPLLTRALRHPRPELRAEALQLSTLAARSALARPALEQVAKEDPVEELRVQAQRALARRQRH
jgi:hypothetical protein